MDIAAELAGFKVPPKSAKRAGAIRAGRTDRPIQDGSSLGSAAGERVSARAERLSSAKMAFVLLACCALIVLALWPTPARRDPYTSYSEVGK